MKKPWYWPCFPAGASSYVITQVAADWVISPATWTRAARASRAAATTADRPADAANARHAAASRKPATRNARTAAGSVPTRLVMRIWNRITDAVFTTSSAATSGRGASVWVTTHSGIATSRIEKWMIISE
jgi:hypothetical protein